MRTPQHFYASSRLDFMKNSPYIGWFRHAPPSTMRLHELDYRNMALSEKCHALAMILANLPSKEKSHPGLSGIITGRLCGGGKETCYNVRGAIGGSENGSLTASSFLAKLGTWILYPLAQDAESLYCDRNLKRLTEGGNQCDEDEDEGDSGEDHDASEDDDDDDEDSVSLSDFDGPVTPIAAAPYPRASNAEPVDVSVSEIAEAYYAHQIFGQAEYSSLEGDRLDYVITQADIARMARNAARHLDVDSILNLPTTTYRSPKRCVKSQSEATDSRGPDEAWSFIMVPKSASKSLDVQGDEGIVDTECVICLEPFVDGDRLRVLPCNHSFHVGCIDRWLSGSHSHHECFTSGCPTCKKRPALSPVGPSSGQELEQNNGSVPSWAFAKLGSQMAQSLGE